MRINLFAATVLGLGCLLTGGCPTGTRTITDNTPSGPVTPILTLSASQLAPGDLLVASAGSSSSTAGAISRYDWDFGGEHTAQGATASYRFNTAGTYTVALTVTDAAGNMATTTQEIRIGAPGSITVTPRITADIESGPPALGVQFDGTGSTATGDDIRDFFWDFGDGGTARSQQPFHIFNLAGNYEVTLRVVTASGEEAETTLMIRVAQDAGSSLQFSGTQFATLAITGGSAQDFSQFTFSAWFKPEPDSGTVAAIGPQVLTIEAASSGREITLHKGSETVTAATTFLTRQWHHLTITYDAGNQAAIYIDGRLLASGVLNGAVNASTITIGQGFEGKVAKVGFFDVVRSTAQIEAAYDSGLDGSEADLLGYWPFENGGSAQKLVNKAIATLDGSRGLDRTTENEDPAWSTDGPPE